MNRSCKHCGRTHPIGQRCPLAPIRIKRSTESNSFRSTWAWTQKAIQIKTRDNYLCLVCLSKGVITTSGLEVHHIVPIAEDESLALEDDNLITLCEACHKAAERGEISRHTLIAQAAAGSSGIPPGAQPVRNQMVQDHDAPPTHTKVVK